MQDLCAFAHASEVSMRENQRIRRRIVHGENKGNSVFFETCKLFGLYSENLFDFLDYIPKFYLKIRISTIKKDFCGFLMASNHSQVDCGLRDHFGTTIGLLWAFGGFL